MSKRTTKGRRGTALSDEHTSIVRNQLGRIRDNYRRQMTAWTMPMEELIDYMFHSADLQLCRQAFAICCRHNQIGMERFPISRGVTIELRSDAREMILPNRNRQACSEIPGLAAYAAEVRQIYMNFRRVEILFDWYNDHANAGALRAYCPWVASLVDFECGSRYREPDGLATQLEMTREAPGIVASALLAPTPGERNSIYSLNFDGYGDEVTGYISAFSIDV